jgi:hypothetical protein
MARIEIAKSPRRHEPVNDMKMILERERLSAGSTHAGVDG